MKVKHAPKKTPAAKPPKSITVHFCPTKQQAHFGPADKALCGTEVPQYAGKALSHGGANTPENITCTTCERMYKVRDRLCRGCGTMITETTRTQYGALCPKCGGKIRIIELDKDNQITGHIGKPMSKEEQAKIQASLDLEAAEKNERIAARMSGGYGANRSEATEPAGTGNKPEDTVKTKTETKEKGSKKPAETKGQPEALKKAAEARKAKDSGFLAQKITVLVKENPKRGKSAERFGKYKTGMTVEKFIELGGYRADIPYDVEHKFIKLGK